MMDDLRHKIQDFNSELNAEVATNQKLNRQCNEYAEKLRDIQGQFDSYKVKKDTKIETLEEKVHSLKSQLKDERDKVGFFLCYSCAMAVKTNL